MGLLICFTYLLIIVVAFISGFV